MSFEENFDKLENQIKLKKGEGLTFNLSYESEILPFTSRESRPHRPNFKNGISAIIGEFSRIMFNKSLDFSLSSDKIIENMLINNSIEMNYEKYGDYLKLLITDYLQKDDSKLKISNPNLFLYINQSSDTDLQNNEYGTALFFRDIFFNESNFYNKFKSFFEEYESKDIIVDMISANIPELTDSEIDPYYIPKLDHVIEIFRKDLTFLLENNMDFLLENLESIFIFYYFFYASQLILKLDKDFAADLSSNEEVYYCLDWESATKDRTRLKYLGYERLKKSKKILLGQIYLIDYINVLFGSKGLLLNQIYEEFNKLPDSEQEEFLKYFKMFADDFHDARKIENRDYDYKLTDTQEKTDFKILTNYLYNGLLNTEIMIKKRSKDYKGIGGPMRDRYGENIFDVGAIFLKNGFQGRVLSLNPDMFLMVTALCTQDKKIKLTKLFEEYQKRGLYFDNKSKEEIESYLNKLNYIEKKSDNWGAQYVKPLL